MVRETQHAAEGSDHRQDSRHGALIEDVHGDAAAHQLGCDVAHIAKSIVFAGQDGAVVVITSGANRVERKRKLKRLLGYKPSMTGAEYIIENTGYAPGGVPPFGHMKPCTVLMDEDLMQYDLVWGAGGTAQTVFPISPDELLSLSGATVADVKQ